jgi:hypothetical protein
MNTVQFAISRAGYPLRFFLLGALLLVMCAKEALSLTLDSFEDQSELSSSPSVGVSNSSFKQTSGAIGGDRQLIIVKTSAGTGVARFDTGGGVLGYTQGFHAGLGIITWDGDRNPNTLTPNGLGSIDMAEDGGDAFVIQLLSFDYPSNREILISLRLFDPSSSKKFSEVRVTINKEWFGPGAFTILLPFSRFAVAGSSTVPAPGGGTFATITTHGSDGSASPNAVGAVRLQFEGFAGDADIGALKTNGRCASVPNALGRVTDPCGVCLEAPSANQGKDVCGTCLAGPPGYSYTTARVLDACGFCPGQASYQFPDGKKDACGTCGGSENNIARCFGSDSACTSVQATAEVKQFQKRLATKAKALRTQFNQERKRGKRNKCKIPVADGKKLFDSSYQKIMRRGKEIFLSGVEVCGNSCITTSYAQQVETLLPDFKVMQRETLFLARAVKNCYARRGIVRQGEGGGRGVSGTIGTVTTGLQDLINDCKEQRVCPPGAK